jgi:hypothetical protein
MFDWIPLPIYTNVFYHLLLVMTLVVGHHCMSYNIRNQQSITTLGYIGFFIMVFILFYMGLRPVSGRFFGDMGTYNKIYIGYQRGEPYRAGGDVLFHRFMWLSSKVMSAKQFFLLVDIIYILPMYWFSRVYFKKYWFFGLFMFFASFSFWSYGTNGIRNGMATSLFLAGLCFYPKRKLLMYGFFALSFYMHASLVIPIAAFLTTHFLLKKPKLIFIIWLICIPLSLVGGSTWGALFESFGLFEERTQGYLTGGEKFMDQFDQTGFRWDFLLYSSTAIIAGWYFIIKKKLEDSFYNHLFGVYAIANAFWILVINAAFSNRFAYLSWFLMGAVIIYPLAKYDILKDQYKILGAILILYFMFTYLLNVILG